MAAVRMLFGSLLTIAAFALLLDVTLLMGVLFMYFLKKFLRLLWLRFRVLHNLTRTMCLLFSPHYFLCVFFCTHHVLLAIIV